MSLPVDSVAAANAAPMISQMSDIVAVFTFLCICILLFRIVIPYAMRNSCTYTTKFNDVQQRAVSIFIIRAILEFGCAVALGIYLPIIFTTETFFDAQSIMLPRIFAYGISAMYMFELCVRDCKLPSVVHHLVAAGSILYADLDSKMKLSVPGSARPEEIYIIGEYIEAVAFWAVGLTCFIDMGMIAYYFCKENARLRVTFLPKFLLGLASFVFGLRTIQWTVVAYFIHIHWGFFSPAQRLLLAPLSAIWAYVEFQTGFIILGLRARVIQENKASVSVSASPEKHAPTSTPSLQHSQSADVDAPVHAKAFTLSVPHTAVNRSLCALRKTDSQESLHRPLTPEPSSDYTCSDLDVDWKDDLLSPLTPFDDSLSCISQH
eukprot:ANDGO_00082.mRNA.1 hypothetical protein